MSEIETDLDDLRNAVWETYNWIFGVKPRWMPIWTTMTREELEAELASMRPMVAAQSANDAGERAADKGEPCEVPAEYEAHRAAWLEGFYRVTERTEWREQEIVFAAWDADSIDAAEWFGFERVFGRAGWTRRAA